MSNYKRLILQCASIVDSYDPVNVSLEDHLELFMSKHKDLDDSDQTFISEVFSGCVRYANIMKVVTDGFFIRDGKTSLRSEEKLYTVLCYIALFRLDEIGMAHYRKFISSQDVNKMYKFLNFFLNEKNLRTWIKDAWNQLYEPSFVQTTLLSPILRWLPELQEIIQYLSDKIENKIKPKKPAVKNTDVKPFNITQPRPRSVPMPEPIPKLEKHKPTPKSTYSKPKEQNFIAEIKEQNRRLAEERLMEAANYQFACANPEKSHKAKKRIQKIIAEEEGKINFEIHKANPLPTSMSSKAPTPILRSRKLPAKFWTENVPIKLNTAAILREGKLFRKREEEVLKKLESLETGAKDASDFLEWQSKMKQQDLEDELSAIERRRLEGILSHEDAILARQNLIQENKEKVQEMKEEAQQMMQEYLEKRLEEEKEMRKLVEAVMGMHENAKEAKKKLQEYKAKMVQEVNRESQELMRQALEEAEEEMRRKIDLINQIRAMEAVPVIRHKFVDLTSTAGFGLLGEMSIAELRERVALLRTAEKEAEEEKRDRIIENKTQKDQMLMDALNTISKHRAEQSKVAAERLEIKKKTRLIKRPEVIIKNNDKLLELERKIEEKKQQRLQERQKEKAASKKPPKINKNYLMDEKKQKPESNNLIISAEKADKKIAAVAAYEKAAEARRWAELEATNQRMTKYHSHGLDIDHTAPNHFNAPNTSRLGVIYQNS